MTRKCLSLLLCCALILGASQFGINTTIAADIVESGPCVENLTYTLDSDGLLTISGEGVLDGRFSYNPDIKQVIINNGVTSIGHLVFEHCSSLTNVTIPDSVTGIGYGTFSCCSELKSITIPESVRSIGVNAFYSCHGLQSVQFESGDVNISKTAFLCCGNPDTRTVITIPAGKTAVNEEAFRYAYADVHFLGDLPEFKGERDSKYSRNVICYYPCGNETWNTELPETVEWRVAHSWNSGEITKEPTAESDGEKTYTCTVCGETETETIPKSADDYMPGDVDGNGQVLANDARLALRASAKLETLDERQKNAADVDGSGDVLADDARQILRFSAKLQNEFVKK